jgi:hypothetical protein
LKDFQGKDRAKIEKKKPSFYGQTNVVHEKLRSGGQ